MLLARFSYLIQFLRMHDSYGLETPGRVNKTRKLAVCVIAVYLGGQLLPSIAA